MDSAAGRWNTLSILALAAACAAHDPELGRGWTRGPSLPEPIQEKLSAALQAALRDEKLRQRYAELLTDIPAPERQTIAFHRRFVAEEVARWRPIIQAAGAYAD